MHEIKTDQRRSHMCVNPSSSLLNGTIKLFRCLIKTSRILPKYLRRFPFVRLLARPVSRVWIVNSKRKSSMETKRFDDETLWLRKLLIVHDFRFFACPLFTLIARWISHLCSALYTATDVVVVNERNFLHLVLRSFHVVLFTSLAAAAAASRCFEVRSWKNETVIACRLERMLKFAKLFSLHTFEHSLLVNRFNVCQLSLKASVDFLMEL